MFTDPATMFTLATANHAARVRSAGRHHRFADAMSDLDWSRHTTRRTVWRRQP
jgi:hypothetical protein